MTGRGQSLSEQLEVIFSSQPPAYGAGTCDAASIPGSSFVHVNDYEPSLKWLLSLHEPRLAHKSCESFRE